MKILTLDPNLAEQHRATLAAAGLTPLTESESTAFLDGLKLGLLRRDTPADSEAPRTYPRTVTAAPPAKTPTVKRKPAPRTCTRCLAVKPVNSFPRGSEICFACLKAAPSADGRAPSLADAERMTKTAQ
ncbi:MAG TPA: hypothetical protein PLI98_11200 [Candidatus Hydrogenedentes bacterium]|nr:hypothetical protein [Candidatus Hydrogenedentota bacterium]